MMVGVKLGVVAAGHKYSASIDACPHTGLLIMPVARHRLHAKRHGTEEDRAVHFVEGGGLHLHLGNVRLRQETHPDVLCVHGLDILQLSPRTRQPRYSRGRSGEPGGGPRARPGGAVRSGRSRGACLAKTRATPELVVGRLGRPADRPAERNALGLCDGPAELVYERHHLLVFPPRPHAL